VSVTSRAPLRSISYNPACAVPVEVDQSEDLVSVEVLVPALRTA